MQIDEDEVMAAIDLGFRCGATDFEMGFTEDDDRNSWWAHVQFRGARVSVERQSGPVAAASALAQRLLDGASCRCTLLVSLSGKGSDSHCRWRRVGAKWEPGCDAPPLDVKGQRGDLGAMQRALDGAAGNRAARRRAARGKR